MAAANMRTIVAANTENHGYCKHGEPWLLQTRRTMVAANPENHGCCKHETTAALLSLAGRRRAEFRALVALGQCRLLETVSLLY